MLIALIDDGIAPVFLKEEIQLKHDLLVETDGSIRECSSLDKVRTDHGTTCAGIITKYAPEAEFCSLRIFHGDVLQASCAQLVSALKWCLKAKIPIVHMSIGTNRLSDYIKIRPIIAKLIQQNQIIIAACSNKEKYSIPAVLGGVFGVIVDEKLKDNEYVIKTTLSGCHILQASSKHTLKLTSEYEYVTQISNSYAAPTITSTIHNILAKYQPLSLNAAQIYHILEKGDNLPCYLKADFIEDAVLFNTCNYPILSQHLFFNCISIETKLSFTSNNDNYCKRKDIVYIAPSDYNVWSNEFLYLKENRECYNALLYAGALPPEYAPYFVEKMVWSENIYARPLWHFEKEKEDFMCPIVYIYGTEFCSIDILCQLRNLFLSNGYECIGVCNYPFSYLYSLEYVPSIVDKNYVIENINSIYKPDIILCSFKDEIPDPKSCPDDFFVILGDFNSYKNVKNILVKRDRIDAITTLSIFEKIIEFYN